MGARCEFYAPQNKADKENNGTLLRNVSEKKRNQKMVREVTVDRQSWRCPFTQNLRRSDTANDITTSAAAPADSF